MSVNNHPLLLFVKVTIPTGRPWTAPGTSRICVSCFKSTGTPLSSQNCSRWSTGKCRWGASGTVVTAVPLGRSKCLALLQCSPRNSTSDQKSNSFRPQTPGKQGLLKEDLKEFSCFSPVLYCMLLMDTVIHVCIEQSDNWQPAYLQWNQRLWNNRNNFTHTHTEEMWIFPALGNHFIPETSFEIVVSFIMWSFFWRNQISWLGKTLTWFIKGLWGFCICMTESQDRESICEGGGEIWLLSSCL